MYNGNGTSENPYSVVVLGRDEDFPVFYVYVIELDVITTIDVIGVYGDQHFFLTETGTIPTDFYEYMQKFGTTIKWLQNDYVQIVEV